jgi:hypothetical protein
MNRLFVGAINASLAAMIRGESPFINLIQSRQGIASQFKACQTIV